MKKILPTIIGTLLILNGICIMGSSSNIAIIDNQPPSAPIINGPMRGNVGEDYSFTISSTDPDGDDVSYIIDWNDGTNLEITEFFPSGEEISLNHTWDSEGAFSIMVGAIDIYNLTSEPTYWLIGIGKSKIIERVQLNFHHISTIMVIKKILKQLFG